MPGLPGHLSGLQPSTATLRNSQMGTTANARKGAITTTFTACCAICGEQQSGLFENKDKFIDNIDDKWRITTEHGWVHKKCCKMMPTSLKFNAQPTTA